MVAVIYVQHEGGRHEVDLPIGETVMQGAVNNMIDGILGDCGGALACATCHCYVDAAWVDRLDPPSAAENEMLEIVTAERRANSRLSCQIKASQALDGLVVFLPESQF